MGRLRVWSGSGLGPMSESLGSKTSNYRPGLPRPITLSARCYLQDEEELYGVWSAYVSYLIGARLASGCRCELPFSEMASKFFCSHVTSHMNFVHSFSGHIYVILLSHPRHSPSIFTPLTHRVSGGGDTLGGYKIQTA